jgi:hypothetical protein
MRRDEPAGTGSPLNSNATQRIYLRPVELGELHEDDCCAWCGSSASPLRITTLVWTHAPAALCRDTFARATTT